MPDAGFCRPTAPNFTKEGRYSVQYRTVEGEPSPEPKPLFDAKSISGVVMAKHGNGTLLLEMSQSNPRPFRFSSVSPGVT